jgi:hypothetical protein
MKLKQITIWATLLTLLTGSPVIADEYQNEFNGVLKVGKQYSYIFYFGEQSGDTVAYFFKTQSAVGQQIMSVCKNNQRCSGNASLRMEDKIPKEIPETTSGTYKIISVSKLKSR